MKKLLLMMMFFSSCSLYVSDEFRILVANNTYEVSSQGTEDDWNYQKSTTVTFDANGDFEFIDKCSLHKYGDMSGSWLSRTSKGNYTLVQTLSDTVAIYKDIHYRKVVIDDGITIFGASSSRKQAINEITIYKILPKVN